MARLAKPTAVADFTISAMLALLGGYGEASNSAKVGEERRYMEQELGGAVYRSHRKAILYRAIHPPSTGRITPWIKSEAGDAKKTAAPAISSGFPHRPAGIRPMMDWDRSGSR